jgi:hypothetical protein
MRYGPDALGGKHYQRALLRSLEPDSAVGIFLRTFGDSRKTVVALAQSGKVAELVVHLAPFDNTHRYEFAKYGPQVKADAAWLEGVAQQFPGVRFLLSAFCEHNHSRAKMAPLFAEIKTLAPSCLMLNSIWKGEECPGTITEIHLENSRLKKKPKNEYTVSFDGFGGDGSGDMPDADVSAILANYSDARHIRSWNFRFNGKFGHKDDAPVSQRKHWPDVRYLRGHAAMMKEREGAVTWPAKALYKPFADDHGAGGKDNKAMAILPRKRPRVGVFDSQGHKIATMARLLPDHAGDPKGARYYSRLYAYQLGDLAEERTGSRQIRIGDSPLTDADLRSGRFK